MNEVDILDDIFGAKWKGKYTVSYCHACDTAIIICPECHNASCTGGGCEKCIADFKEFYDTIVHNVRCYLNIEESKAYEKGIRLQSLIVESVGRGEWALDFNKLKKEGYLSENDEKMFANLAG